MRVEGVNSSADHLLQVWSNAAFENPNSSFDSVSEKENWVSPLMVNQIISPVSLSTTPFKPVNRDISVEKSRIKGFGFVEEDGFLKKGLKIDVEIEKIESEISLLKSRLEVLRLEKVERNVKMVEKRGKTVEERKKIEALSARTEVQRRGLSLGSEEIVSTRCRGMSLGPSEIFGAVKSKQMNTPVSSRRLSCFYKLEDIVEEKVGPKSRQRTIKNQVSTIASIEGNKLFKDGEKSVFVTTKKPPLRQERVVASRYNQNANQASSMKKRSLPDMCDKERSLWVGKSSVDATGSKNLGTEIRLKSIGKFLVRLFMVVVVLRRVKSYLLEFNVVLPRINIARLRNESPRDSGQAKRVSELIGKKSFFAVDDDDEESEKLSPEFSFVLPRIKTSGLRNESPRDSGPAKRVAELIGKKFFFANDDDDEALVCQALDYDEEEVEEG